MAIASDTKQLVIISFTDAWGGTEVLVQRTAEEAVRRRWHVTIVQVGHTQFSARGVAHDGIATLDVPGTLHALTARGWHRLLRAHKPDTVVLLKGDVRNRALALDLACRWLRVRYVLVEAHLPPIMPPCLRPGTVRRKLGGLARYLRHHAIFRVHFLMASRVIAVSGAVRERLVAHFGYRASISVIYNGVDTHLFSPSVAARRATRDAWGVGHDDVVVGAVGRLDPIKRLDWVISAFARIAKEDEARSLWLVLGGNGSSRAALEAQAKQLGIAHRVRFLGWVTSLPDVNAALDVYALSSASEGFGIAIIEAMAAGCACVVTDAGGPREIISDASLGWLVPVDDEAAFGRALRDAIQLTPAQRAALGARARASVVERFDEGIWTPRLVDAILS